jgi:Flp pilus assembly protein TadG
MSVQLTPLRRLSANQKGTAAIEFALVLPVMIALFMGIFEASNVVSAKMRLYTAAQSMADMMAQQASVSPLESSNYCSGAKMTMYPLPGGSLKVATASVTRGASSVVVDWTDNICGAATAITDPTGLASSLTANINDSVVVAQATFAYASPVSYLLAASYTLVATAYARPRNVTTVGHS